MAKNSIYMAHNNLLTVRKIKKRPEPNIHEEKAREVDEIRDIMSQTTETKNTNGSQCLTVTLRPTFWGLSVTILVGRTIHPLFGLNVTWSERFWVVQL